MAIGLRELDQVGPQSLGRLGGELFEVDHFIAVFVSAFHDLDGLLVFDPLESEGLQAVADLFRAQLAVAILVGGFEHLPEHKAAKLGVGGVDEGGNDLRVLGDDFGTQRIKLFSAHEGGGTEDNRGEDSNRRLSDFLFLASGLFFGSCLDLFNDWLGRLGGLLDYVLGHLF